MQPALLLEAAPDLELGTRWGRGSGQGEDSLPAPQGAGTPFARAKGAGQKKWGYLNPQTPHFGTLIPK